MKVILVKDIDYLGLANEVVEVKSGYGRNYLIPQGLALELNPRNVAKQKAIEKKKQKEQEELMEKIKSVIEQLESTTLNIPVKTGISGKIFGKVTTLQISREIKKKLGFEIDRKLIETTEMTHIGSYSCIVKLDKHQNKAEVKINLVAPSTQEESK